MKPSFERAWKAYDRSVITCVVMFGLTVSCTMIARAFPSWWTILCAVFNFTCLWLNLSLVLAHRDRLELLEAVEPGDVATLNHIQRVNFLAHVMARMTFRDYLKLYERRRVPE